MKLQYLFRVQYLLYMMNSYLTLKIPFNGIVCGGFRAYLDIYVFLNKASTFSGEIIDQ